ncbi:hypothetical protein FF100_11470 [Methylobacterium terricola]|uniref:Uncharacterized protein n=1 Tax=Methylobacterium terricola TaxID=2583531 RepID=A0A5C4LK45_9HYPH|nr:hypothetical protein FF100_11470 [Methylobacterium terricola]
MWLPALAGLVGAALPAAAEDTLYAKAGGFDIQRPDGGPVGGLGCNALRTSLEASDGNAEKAVIVTPKSRGLALTVAYERWDWKAGKPPKPRYRLEGQGAAQEIVPLPGELVADSYALGTLFPFSVLSRFQAATRVVIEAGGTRVPFDLTGLRQAYDVVLRCNRDEPVPAVPQPGPAAGTPSAAGASTPAIGASPSTGTSPPVAGPTLSAEVAPRPAGPAPSPAGEPLPTEARLGAYLVGRGLQDQVERCDLATTARQRRTLDAKVEALRPEMRKADDAIRTTLKEEAGRPCPEAGDPIVREALDLYLRATPEAFAAEWDRKTDGVMVFKAREILKTLQPAAPPRARQAAFLYGLMLQDLIAHCDIATTARQRAGLTAKLDAFRMEMAAQEPDLQKEKGAFTTCPAGDTLAEFQAAMPLFLERSPEDFAAEMDRRSAARTAAQAREPQGPEAQAPDGRAALAPKAEAGCRKAPFPQNAALLRQSLVERFRRELPDFEIEDLTANKDAASFAFMLRTDESGDRSGFFTLHFDAGRADYLAVSGPVGHGGWRRAVILVVAHAIAVFDPTQDRAEIDRKLSVHVTERPRSVDKMIAFGPVFLSFLGLRDGDQSITVQRWDGAECWPGSVR